MSGVQLKADGTILLGDNFSCDGFSYQCPFRIQTHIHQDHMVDFNTSKANQTIVMTPQTRKLLYAIFNADLPYRTNIVAVDFETPLVLGAEILELVPSNHMLGSAQVKVTCSNGHRLGYSSDFNWPLHQVIEVDELIVDATYGAPCSSRAYKQHTVDEKLIELVWDRLRGGRQTALIGWNGRLHYAMALFAQIPNVPIICSRHAFPLVSVYEEYGYPMPTVFRADSPEAIAIVKSRTPCLAFVSFQDRRHLSWVDRFSKIALSAYMTGCNDPILDYGNGDCRIAFTDHADFEDTLQYVAATGAQLVWTDPRSGDAEGLAIAISQNLGIESRVPTQIRSLAWG